MRRSYFLSSTLVALLVCGATNGFGGTFEEVTNFGQNPGELKMYRYIPDGIAPNAPLVFALHACTQTARGYHDSSGWAALADQYGFHVVYPEQQTRNNGLQCFNWAGEFGDPTNLRRGEGENQSIKEMLDKMVADHAIDTRRVFAMGHSGGGAQVALMLATWPELFRAGGIIAGIPYNCTTTFTEVSTCLSPGLDKTPEQWGGLVRDAVSGFSGPYPRVSIWHGTSDNVVAIRNQNELLEQWTNVHGVDMTADSTSMVGQHTRSEYRNGAGDVVVETWRLQGMGHGTPVQPGSGCGRQGGYFLDVGICSAMQLASFFGLDGTVIPPPADAGTSPVDAGSASMDAGMNNPTDAGNVGPPDAGTGMGGDTTPPTVNITSPTSGTDASGIITIEVAATDEVRVNQVLLFLDDTIIGTDRAAPFEFLFDARQVDPGNYRLVARAFDDAGNLAVDDDTTINIVSTTDEEPAGEQPEPILIGKRRWGCTASAAPADLVYSAALLLGAIFFLRRRRAS